MPFKLTGYKYSEYDCQCTLVAWLNLIKSQRKDFTYHASPSGLINAKILGMAFKSGTRKGWPDIQIHFRSGKTIFLELKKTKGIVSPNQKIIHAELKALGYDVHIVRFETPNECVEKVKAILEEQCQLSLK